MVVSPLDNTWVREPRSHEREYGDKVRHPFKVACFITILLYLVLHVLFIQGIILPEAIDGILDQDNP